MFTRITKPGLSDQSRNAYFRGTLPCDVLFVSMAGENADLTSGLPLSGPSGQLLDELIHEAMGEMPLEYASPSESLSFSPHGSWSLSDVTPIESPERTIEPRFSP
jgi:hypothetical protein